MEDPRLHSNIVESSSGSWGSAAAEEYARELVLNTSDSILIRADEVVGVVRCVSVQEIKECTGIDQTGSDLAVIVHTRWDTRTRKCVRLTEVETRTLTTPVPGSIADQAQYLIATTIQCIQQCLAGPKLGGINSVKIPFSKDQVTQLEFVLGVQFSGTKRRGSKKRKFIDNEGKGTRVDEDTEGQTLNIESVKDKCALGRRIGGMFNVYCPQAGGSSVSSTAIRAGFTIAAVRPTEQKVNSRVNGVRFSFVETRGLGSTLTVSVAAVVTTFKAGDSLADLRLWS
jgi:hypothetical protein